MIYDRLNNCEQYYSLNEKFEKAFNFLKNTDLKAIPDGSYEIDGKEIYANVQSLKTKLVEDKKWEDADNYAEKVLDLNPENAEAYLVKLISNS